jgi:formate dehydrogenase
MAANALLYGSVANLPLPDLWRTHFVLILGANPMVSKGSLVSEPQFREALASVVERGGRVVVVDPRRSETASHFEHLPVLAGTDAYLLLGILHTLVSEDLIDHSFLATHTKGYDRLVELVSLFDPDVAAAVCRVPAAQIRELARAFAAAPSGVVYGRTGTCTQRFGTLNNLLQDLVMIVTGNVEKEGGWLFGWGPIDFAKFAEKSGTATYASFHSRVTNMPEVSSVLPSTSLVPDITEPGAEQVRALMSIGCNPVLTSAGGGAQLEAALEELELHFSLDLYVNETNKHAHYILPVTGMFERDGVPLVILGLQLQPSIWAVDAVIEPRGDTRDDWKILDEIAARMGLGGAYAAGPLRWLAKRGLRVKPGTLVDLVIRTSAAGDWFGLRPSGVSVAKLKKHHPHGKLLRKELPTGQLTKKLRTADKKVDLGLPELERELARLGVEGRGPDIQAFPLRLLGMREIRSHNSWMHNVERLMAESREHLARVSPSDAADAGLADGDLAIITSKSASVTIKVRVTDEMSAGNIAVPHGWGHDGGWRRANRAGGVNSNVLASHEQDDIEPLAGMSILNGIPVRLARA